MGVKSLVAKSNSQFVVKKFNRMYKIEVPYLAKYFGKVKGLLENFEHFEVERILQLENDYINALVKLVTMKTSNGNQSIIRLIVLTPLIEKE